jgi:uncharacterized protein
MEFQKAKDYILQRLKNELPIQRTYHSVAHIQDVEESAKRLGIAEGINGTDMNLLLTAALYHDSGFMIQSHEHERVSCEIARQNLPQFGYTSEQVDIICGMIMATKVPQEPKNHLEKIICDADLDYLGRDDFFEIGNQLADELQAYGIIKGEKEWDKLQIRFLDEHHYWTKTAINTRKARKDQYLEFLKQKVME